MKNKAREILEAIDVMKARKVADLEEISQKAAEASERALQADDEMKKASEALDLPRYTEAKNAKESAAVAAEMYARRYEQLERKEHISEEESDAVIDSLLEYEDALESEFEKAIKEPIRKLSELRTRYVEAVNEAELALTRWTSEIHRNYRSQGTTYQDGTNRSPSPVPVHSVPYTGCGKSATVGTFLEKIGKS